MSAEDLSQPASSPSSSEPPRGGTETRRPGSTAPIERSLLDRARTWGRSATQVTMATTLPAWELGALGLALLAAFILVGLYAALLLVGAFFLGELLAVGYVALRSRRSTEPRDPGPNPPRATGRPPESAGSSGGRLRAEQRDLQRWEDDGGATRSQRSWLR